MADRILLTKTDLATPAQIAETEARIATLNATAPLRHVVGGAVDAADVFDLGPDSARLEQWLRPMETGGHHGHQHLPFRHGEQIGSVVLRHDRPIAWASLRRWLESVLSLRGDAVLRLKGIVWLQGETQPIVLQGVHHVLHPPVYLDRPVQPEGATRIVLITRGLSPVGLRASFAAALAGGVTD
jgi:G3E family GTPase